MAKKDAKKSATKQDAPARKKDAPAGGKDAPGKKARAARERDLPAKEARAARKPGKARAAAPSPARPLVAVDTAVLTVLPPDVTGTGLAELAVLQCRSGSGGWALPGTLLAEGESLAQAAGRSLGEAGGPGEGVRPRQLPVCEGADGVLTVPHLAWVPHERVAPVVAAGDGGLRLAPVGDAGTERAEVVAAAVERARREYEEAADPGGLLPGTFTLHELFVVHDAVAGHFDSTEDAFRLRIARHVEATGESVRRQAGRPARLYRRRTPD